MANPQPVPFTWTEVSFLNAFEVSVDADRIRANHVSGASLWKYPGKSYRYAIRYPGVTGPRLLHTFPKALAALCKPEERW